MAKRRLICVTPERLPAYTSYRPAPVRVPFRDDLLIAGGLFSLIRLIFWPPKGGRA